MSVHHTAVTPVPFVFADDGLVPNNPMPLLIYKGAFEFEGCEPETFIEDLFISNGWGQMWRNGVFDYLHYHATVHEALGVARGRALVRFGGERGADFELSQGDVAILPAGTGHQCLSANADFVVVGAYPPGPLMNITRPTKENHRRALQTIPKVPMPKTDPIYGATGPLVQLWGKAQQMKGR